MPLDALPDKSGLPPDRLTALAELAWLLRNPHRWPEGFELDYMYLDTCAIGLCDQAFGRSTLLTIFGNRAAETLMSGEDYDETIMPRGLWHTFFDRVWSKRRVTAIHLAADIERYVASKLARQDHRQLAFIF